MRGRTELCGNRPATGLGFFVEGRNLSDKTYAATTGVIADVQGQDSAVSRVVESVRQQTHPMLEPCQ